MLYIHFIMIYRIYKISVLPKINRILKFLQKIINLKHIMMKSSRFYEDEIKEENIIKDVRNLFRLAKENKVIKYTQRYQKIIINS